MRRAFRALGTDIDLRLWPAPGRQAPGAAALARAVTFLRRAEARLSRFDAGSDIGRLNRAAGRPVHVSGLTCRVIGAALDAAQATGGLFDPTVYRALRAAGYDRSFEQLGARRPPAGTGATAGATGHFQEVVLDRRAGRVCLPAGAGLDLGGIAKGWLADVVVQRLGAYGAAAADLGGDLALTGPPPGQDTWEVEVVDPRDQRSTLGWLLVRRGGVATSGVLRRRWQTGRGPAHHLIDPRTGRPADSDLAAVTVVAPAAAAAEVAAKAVLLLGSADGRRILEQSESLAGVLVPKRGPAVAVGEVAWRPAATVEA